MGKVIAFVVKAINIAMLLNIAIRRWVIALLNANTTTRLIAAVDKPLLVFVSLIKLAPTNTAK
jgi:glutaredoxin 2